jgi:hypothetical protein
MHYKTIVLELLQDQPALHERLRATRSLLQTLERSAALLRTRHAFWMTELGRKRGATHPSQLSSSALEIAVEELRDALALEMTSDDPEPLSLDEAMDFLTRYVPRA